MGTYLSCSIYDFALVFNAVELDGLVEGGLDSRVIRFDEVVLDELNDEGGLS